MNTHCKPSISDIRTMILCAYPLSTEEYAHLYYDGDGVNKSLEEAYVWYTVAQLSGNHRVDCLVNYLNSRLTKPTCNKLSSRAKHIYAKALSLITKGDFHTT
jgi:TPR repeat protein